MELTGARLAEAVAFALETLAGGAELKGPEESVRLFECWAAGVDFVNQIFDAVNAVFPQVLLNQLVVLQTDALLGARLAHLG